MAGRILLEKIYIWKYSTTNKLIKARTGTAGNSTKKKKKEREKKRKRRAKNIPIKIFHVRTTHCAQI